MTQNATLRNGLYALTLPEIRLKIFGELDTTSLLNMALVCKAWTWPATDTILQKCHIPLSTALSPLIECEPKQFRDHSFWGRVPEVPVTLNHWNQYRQEYGGRIAHLIVDINPDATFNFKLERVLGNHAGPVFPNLVSLDIDLEGKATEEDEPEDEDRWTPLVQFLIGPDLKNLTLTAYDVTKRVIERNVHTLARIAPWIDNVRIINRGNTSPNYAPFAWIRSLRVEGHIDHDGWKVLANCTRLESIELRDDDSDLNIQPQDYSVTFPQLKSLSIVDCCGFRDRTFVLSLFRNTTMPILWRLEIGVRTYTAAMDNTIRVDILGLVHRRSPLLKEVMINGPVPGYEDISCRVGGGH